MKCNEATEETETRSSEKFLQLSCFIEKGYRFIILKLKIWQLCQNVIMIFWCVECNNE